MFSFCKIFSKALIQNNFHQISWSHGRIVNEHGVAMLAFLYMEIYALPRVILYNLLFKSWTKMSCKNRKKRYILTSFDDQPASSPPCEIQAYDFTLTLNSRRSCHICVIIINSFSPLFLSFIIIVDSHLSDPTWQPP